MYGGANVPYGAGYGGGYGLNGGVGVMGAQPFYGGMGAAGLGGIPYGGVVVDSRQPADRELQNLLVNTYLRKPWYP